ncbi:Ig-like domain-containing protein [Rhodopirellula sp. P2]|uniref:Ig-like domain-containing protein n=1 Tax=Rhodopirellula sp. P2 TaxID=2127060 RepID=UPI0023685882|nr:Ig-like domain-containing protein [Rhodopirellula sp. P2]WDQ16180.1 Ig-like domain-containing protein [Rhodopirellula sp. P2]
MKNLRQLLRSVSPSSSRKRSEDRSRANRSNKRRLLSESLEARQLLAGDVPSVVDSAPQEESTHAVAHNYWRAYDVDNNKYVTALDALMVINHLNSRGEGEALTEGDEFTGFVDVTGDNRVTALDALSVINALNRGEGESEVPLVEFVLAARNLDDSLVDNTTGATDVLPDDNVELTYNVDVNEVFKLEVGVKDLRSRMETGVFRAVTDIIAGQSGVLEPAVGELQQVVFDNSILSASNPAGTITFSYADAPGTTTTKVLSDFLGANNAATEANLAEVIVELSPLIDSVDDITVNASSNSTAGGPSGGGSFTLDITYSGMDLINADIPQLQVSVEIGGTAEPVNVGQVDVKNADGSFNSAPILAALELNSRNANNAQIYGKNRVFGSFELNQDLGSGPVDLFDEIGALGPTNNLPDELGSEFNPALAYDVFSIPVRAVAPTTGLAISLDVPDEGDKVLIYGTEVGKESVPDDMIQLDASSRFILNVTGVSSGLTAANSTLSLTEDDAPTTIDLATLNSGNPAGTTYAISSETENLGDFTLSGSVVTYSPDADAFGTGDQLVYTASDGTDTVTGTIAVTIAGVNDAPSLVDDTATVEQGESTLIDVLANDSAGPGESIADLVLQQPATEFTTTNGGTAIISNGQISYTAAAGYSGSDSFTYTVADGALTATANVVVTVTNSQVGINAANKTVTIYEDNGGGTTSEVLVADLSADNLISINTGGSTITLDNAVITTGNGSVRTVGDQILFIPAQDDFGTTTITYTASNDIGSDTGVITVNITADNTDLTATSDDFPVNEGATVTLDVLANDFDGPGESGVLTITSVTQPAFGTATITENGTRISYTSTGSVSDGDDSFSYTISDGQGGTSTAVVNIDIQDVLDAPVAGNGLETVDEDSGTLTIDLSSFVTLEGSDTVTFSKVSGTDAIGTSAVAANGTLTFTPVLNANGTATIVYRATSTQGSQLSDEGTITINVTPVNDAPTATDRTVTVLEDNSIDIDLNGNVADVDSTGLVITVASNPGNGSATALGNGQIRYTPNADFNGQDSFTYQVTDGSLTTTATVTVNVTDVVSPPVANNGSLSATEDAGAVTLDLSTLINLDSGDSATITITTPPANGNASVSGTSGDLTNSTLSYTPDADYFGSDSLVYTVTNSQGATDTGTISISVAGVNDAPVAGNDTATTVRNRAVTIDVLSNDSLGPANENQVATVSVPTQPANGTVTVNGNNELVFTPNTDFVGTATITYQLSDGQSTDTATVEVTVNDFSPSVVSGQLFVDSIMNIREVIDSQGQIAPVRNGVRDSFEKALGGVAVRLVSPASDNDLGEDIDLVVLTNLDGEYTFEDVAPGRYQVIYNLPNNAVAAGEAVDGIIPIEIGSEGGASPVGTFAFASLGDAGQGNSSILSTNTNGSNGVPAGVEDGEGGFVSFGSDGGQSMFLAGSGFEGVEYAELAMNRNNDAALLTIIEEDGDVRTAQVSGDHLRVNASGTSVQLLGGVNDFDFDASLEDLVESEYPAFRDAIDMILGSN